MTCEIVDIGPDTVGSLITTITEFIKTGPISPGTLTTVPRVKVEYAFTDRPARSEITPFFSGSATGTISTNACATPNITVDMGSHKSTEMSGIGTSTSSTNFNIALNNCPADITAIKYQIDAVTSVLDAANAVVALDGSSSAKGVGVQLLNNAGNVQTLGVENTLAGVNGASSYTIPLRARYRQTEGSVRGGTANSSMTFSILYP
ncbi:major type 1 subunit fimbrin (pilin) [Cupriavidus sp. YR651]|nr:major type 1 subunit fimbrin (pilin) [Cupriavidus sp. YR651]